MKYYTNVHQYGNSIFVRGIDNGNHFQAKVPFKPTLFVRASEDSDSKWSSLWGEKVEPKKLPSMKAAKQFIETYAEVKNFPIYGMGKWKFQYIHENYQGDIEYDIDKMRIWFIDLEVVGDPAVYGSYGFPDIETAPIPIVLISVTDRASEKTVVFGVKGYNKDPSDKFEYKEFKDENSLLRGFIDFWTGMYPDIVSGWNTEGFDVPYLINRIVRLTSEDTVKKLSPYGLISERKIEIRGKEIQTYEIAGINHIDYLNAYKKFGTYSNKESYALAFICAEELDGFTKLNVPGRTFWDQYNDNFDTFVRYNARDTELVLELDKKKKLFDLIITMAYMAKVNFNDPFGPVNYWDVLSYNFLSKKKIAIPWPVKNTSASFEGAWVKDPQVGLFGWNMSFDFSSLYPSIVRQWNVSPETLVRDTRFYLTANDFLNNTEAAQEAMLFAKDHDYALAANGVMFRRDKKGFIPELMEFAMEGRKKAKNKMLKLEQEYETTKDLVLKPKIDALKNLQMALKTMANSGYGAITNKFFRYFDLRMGEAITITGQLSDRHLESKLNQWMNKSLKTGNNDYILMGDTDSLVLNMDVLVNKMGMTDKEKIIKFLDKLGSQEIQKVVNSSITEIFDNTNAFDKVMGAKREFIGGRILLLKKKKYCVMVYNSEGVDYKPFKLKIMGMDIIKSSTPAEVRKMLKSLLPTVMQSTESELQKYVKECHTKFDKLSPEEIAFPRGVTDSDKWAAPDSAALDDLFEESDMVKGKSGTPIHVRASMNYNNFTQKYRDRYNEIANGDKIKFLYLKMPNVICQNVIGFPSEDVLPPEIGVHGSVDRDMMWEKTFMSPLNGIMDAIGWSVSEKSNLEEFF